MPHKTKIHAKRSPPFCSIFFFCCYILYLQSTFLCYAEKDTKLKLKNADRQLYVKEEHFLKPYTKINSNVRLETIKLLGENIGWIPFDLSHSHIFLGPSPGLMETKSKISKWDLIKLKSFCTAKETINRMKRQSLNEKKKEICASDMTDKGLKFKKY